MKSHTVPQKLIEQFAYTDPITGSKRLWRYQKGQPPYGRATPKAATRWDGHFADPTNSAKESELEERLAQKFEDPVNQFIDMLGYRTFVLTNTHIRLLTGYITILFSRSRARRAATDGQHDKKIRALRALLSDDEKLSQLAAKLTLDIIDIGIPEPRMVSKQETQALIELIAIQTNHGGAQCRYVQMMNTMMAFANEKMLNGIWRVIHTDPNKPFVIGDAPVVTWERTDNNHLIYGQGFTRPDVEAFLPMSPTVCLHVLPDVSRSRQVQIPSTDEVNIAQAAFATEHCFTHVASPEIDKALQGHFGSVRLGIDGFSVKHIDYDKMLFEILMKRGLK